MSPHALRHPSPRQTGDMGLGRGSRLLGLDLFPEFDPVFQGADPSRRAGDDLDFIAPAVGNKRAEGAVIVLERGGIQVDRGALHIPVPSGFRCSDRQPRRAATQDSSCTTRTGHITVSSRIANSESWCGTLPDAATTLHQFPPFSPERLDAHAKLRPLRYPDRSSSHRPLEGKAASAGLAMGPEAIAFERRRNPGVTAGETAQVLASDLYGKSRRGEVRSIASVASSGAPQSVGEPGQREPHRPTPVTARRDGTSNHDGGRA